MNKFCLANYRVFQRHQPRLASAVLKHSDRVVHNARNTIPTRALAEDFPEAALVVALDLKLHSALAQ